LRTTGEGTSMAKVKGTRGRTRKEKQNLWRKDGQGEWLILEKKTPKKFSSKRVRMKGGSNPGVREIEGEE